ncbi:MAG: iron-sulfur cluster repair di-iron protein [Bacteroidetes bacterium]|nr:iron-sulfur cluster repair di-iron protein [Bacteroidota bacterium]
MEAMTENILDVTVLEPRMKHPTIFARFDELTEGESLIIHNDHDPKPLYYQLLGERGNIFNWEYLEQGPQWWRVRISKRVTGEKDETVGEIAAKDLRKAEIFKKYNIDFCCGGKKTVKEACAAKGLDVTKIEAELQEADKVLAQRPLPYNEWEPGFLADYIVNTHHTYIRKSLPELVGYATKVAGVHGGRHPELHEIKKLIEEVNTELTAHMMKEERILFPYIKELSANGQQSNGSAFGTVQQPVNIMQMEHESVATLMEEIKQLSTNYTLPEDACASYSLLYRKLAEFDDDLHLHIHLENNILFPKAIELEKNRNKSLDV